MTEFEVQRINQAFDVLEDLAVERYDSIVGRCDNPKFALSRLRSYVSVLTEVKNLLDSYCLLTPGEPQPEERKLILKWVSPMAIAANPEDMPITFHEVKQ